MRGPASFVHFVFSAAVFEECPLDRVFGETVFKCRAGVVEDQRVGFAAQRLENIAEAAAIPSTGRCGQAKDNGARIGGEQTLICFGFRVMSLVNHHKVGARRLH
jgi:hypothetical protein